MLVERKMIDKSAILRGMRAMLGLDQRTVAIAVDISLRTITNAESGALTAKTWSKLQAYYTGQGLTLGVMPDATGELVYMVHVAPTIAALD